MLPAVLTLDNSGKVVDLVQFVNIIYFFLSADVANLPVVSAGALVDDSGIYEAFQGAKKLF